MRRMESLHLDELVFQNFMVFSRTTKLQVWVFHCKSLVCGSVWRLLWYSWPNNFSIIPKVATIKTISRYTDISTAAISAENNLGLENAEQLGTQYNFVKHTFLRNKLKVTSDIFKNDLADCYTKFLNQILFKKLRNLFGIHTNSEHF